MSQTTSKTIGKIDKIYTDGACSGNPGPGGWGTVVYFADGGVQELGGGDRATTNNRMELQAAISGLEYYIASGQKEGIVLYTDSEYVKNGITKWIAGWKKKGWKTSTGKAVLNQDLWEQLDAVHSSKVEWRYVKGHSGDVGNDRCDTIARAYSHNSPIDLKQYSASAAKVNPVNLVGLPLSAIEEMQTSLRQDSVASPTIEVKSNSVKQKDLMPMLRESMERLTIAQQVAENHYLITTQELAAIVQMTTDEITAHKKDWVWRNWLISKVREENGQTLWQLEWVDRVD